MRHLLILLAALLLCAPAQAQTVKALSYGTNGRFITGTNALTFSNQINFAGGNVEITTNGMIRWAEQNRIELETYTLLGDWTFDEPTAVRANLGLGATWLTNTNRGNFNTSIGQPLSAPLFARTSSQDTDGNNFGGIVSALSSDGIHWQATRNYSVFPVFSRDASTIWHSNKWVSVYTDAFNSTNKTFGIATSTNLLSWQTNFSVTLTGTNTTGTARNVWAPEWFVDGTNYYVLVRLSVSTNNNYGLPGVGWMRALDPGTWTNWTAWTPFDSTIRTDANDFYIVKKENLYWLFSHGGTHLSGSQPAGSNIVNNITVQYSTNPFGNYSPLVEITEPLRNIIQPGNGASFFEGPSVVNVAGKRWRLYFQDGLDNTAWAIDSFDDFASWDTNSLQRLQYSGFNGSGHGSVVKIDATNQVGIRQAALSLGTASTLGLGATNIVTFAGLTNNGDITINQTTSSNGLLYIRRTNSEPFLGLANLIASNNTTVSNETLFRVGRAEATNQSAQFGFRVVRTNNGGEGFATFSVFGYNALMMIGPSDRSRTNTATNAGIEADIWTINQTNRVMTLRDTNTGALTMHQDLGFGAGLTNTAPTNTSTPVVWMRVWVGTNSYRVPLYQ